MPTGHYKRTEYHNAISRKNGFQKGSTVNLGRKMKPSQGFQKGHLSYLTEESRKKLAISSSRIWKGKKRPELSGENAYQWKGGLPKCLKCGKSLTSYTAKTCREHIDFKKENNPNWIKDRTKLSGEGRKSTTSIYWIRAVKKRDKKCRIDNKDCKGGLEAHHILTWREYPELRYDINNGITLCHFHHPREYNEEKRLSPYFKKLVEETR